MATIMTAKEMVESLEIMAKEACAEVGVEYEDFIADLAQAMERNGISLG